MPQCGVDYLRRHSPPRQPDVPARLCHRTQLGVDLQTHDAMFDAVGRANTGVTDSSRGLKTHADD